MWRFRWNPLESYGNDDENVPTANETYIDDQPLFVQVAEGLGIQGIRHTDYQTTRARLAAFGLKVPA